MKVCSRNDAPACETTWCQDPEDQNLNSHHYEGLKAHTYFSLIKFQVLIWFHLYIQLPKCNWDTTWIEEYIELYIIDLTGHILGIVMYSLNHIFSVSFSDSCYAWVILKDYRIIVSKMKLWCLTLLRYTVCRYKLHDSKIPHL